MLDADPKANQQIDFNGDLERPGQIMLFIIEEAKESILYCSQRTVKML